MYGMCIMRRVGAGSSAWRIEDEDEDVDVDVFSWKRIEKVR